MKAMNTTTLIKELKNSDQDMEWYPTTNEILQALKVDMGVLDEVKRWNYSYSRERNFLDIGAGNGKVLDFAKENHLASNTCGIEKSAILMNQWRANHLIMGVDFDKTSLLDKSLDVVFCNPPYKQYEAWSSKIIKEVNGGGIIYLVIPERWKNSQIIQEAIRSRDAEVKIVGNFSFENSEDRAARAKVCLLRIELNHKKENDAFSGFFDENFTYPEYKKLDEEKSREELTKGMNLVERLCYGYDKHMEKLYKNYTQVCELDRGLLEEFEITKTHLINSLQEKINNTKKIYWQKLFDGLDKVKERLTHSSRQKIVAKMNQNTGIEFNRDNAYMIIMWVVKHFNSYADSQFIETYEKMVSYANVDNYASNQRVFKERNFEYWYYKNEEHDTSHFKLKTGNRIVLERCGGLTKSSWSYDKGLDESAARYLGDLMTIANNLGFRCLEKQPERGEWETSAAQIYNCTYKGKESQLFKVRTYQNGNMHISFNKQFVQAMNCAFGRLKGWVTSGEEVSKEMGIKNKEAEEFYNIDFSIKADQLLLK